MFTPIQKIPLTKLLTLNHNQLLKEVINTLDKFDLDALYLNDALDMLVQLKPQLKNLEVPYGKHPLTKKMKVKEERRLKLCGIVSEKMQLHIRADALSERNAVKITQGIINRFIVGIRKNNQDVVTELIIQFFRLIDQKMELQEAFAELGFQSYLDELRETNIAHEKMNVERNKSISERTKWDEKLVVKKNCQAVLRNVFNTIELKQMLYPDIDYNPLIESLNNTLVRYNKNINTRDTYNKKRAAKTEQQVHLLSVEGKETGSVTITEKTKEKKKIVEQTTEKTPKKKSNTPILKVSKPQKKESEINCLLDVRKLPPPGAIT